MDNLTKWLKITNQFSKDNEDSKPSHLMLNGYTLYVKNDNINIFNEKYAEVIEQDYNLYIVECKRNIFKLFFDLDFLLSKEKYDEVNKTDNETNLFLEIIKIMNDVIYDFYGKYYDCIITTADIKIVKKLYKNVENPENVTHKEFIKKGFHLHFPDININKNYALEIRKTCIHRITKFKDEFENSINDIVDEHVFTSSGLRMTGSKKGHFVSKTKEFVCEGRPYKLLLTLKNNLVNTEFKTELENNLLMLINNTSIITDDTDITNIVNNPNLDNEKCGNCDVYEEDCKDCKSCKDFDIFDGPNTEKSGNWNRLHKNDPKHIAILKFFNTYIKDYSTKDIKRIYYLEDESVYIIYSHSTYCSNIGKNHNSEHIYFKLKKDGICQKCFCKCDTMDGRKWGFCKDYSSRVIPCTPHIRDILNFKEIKVDKTKIIKNNKVNTDDININALFDDLRNTWYNQFTNKEKLPSKRRTK